MKYANNISELQKKIKHIIIDADIKQQDIALRMNKTKQAVNKLLNDEKSNYTLNTLYKLCEAIDCDLHISITPRDNKNGA